MKKTLLSFVSRRQLPDVNRAAFRAKRLVPVALLALTVAVVVGACSSAERLPKLEGGQGNGFTHEPCDDGAERACGVTLERKNGTLTCYHGRQTCEGGSWGRCSDGTVTKEPDPTSSSTKAFLEYSPAALSDPIGCYSGSVCQSMASWASGTTYADDDEVKHLGGSLNPSNGGIGGAGSDPGEDYYYCVAAALCNGPDAQYEPGVGSDWEDAWTRIGSCLNLCDPGCMYYPEDPPTPIGGGGAGSGGGLGGAPNYPGNPNAPACEHDLCTAGAALPGGMTDAACHECVDEVCAIDASCCDQVSGGWDADCISLVYTTCANQYPPLGLCDFGLWSRQNITAADRSGGNMAIGADGDIQLGVDGNYERIWATGNITIRNSNNVTLGAPGGIVSETGSVTVWAGSNQFIDGVIHAATSVDLRSGTIARSDVLAGTSITGQASARIEGDAYYNTTYNPVVALVGNAYVGQHAQPVLPTPPTIPTRNVTGCGSWATPLGGGTAPSKFAVALPGVQYGDVNISNDGSLTLQGEGNYYFRSLTLDGNLILDSQSAYSMTGFDVTVCNNSTFTEPTNVQGTNGTPVSGGLVDGPSNLVWYTHGNHSMQNNFNWVGVIIVPNGTFTAGNNGSLDGAVWSNSMNIGTDMGSAQISREDCEALGLPGTLPTPGMCPIPNTRPTPPALNEPCSTGRDCQMNNHCIEPETDASCAHSKCQEGAAMDADCDTCVDLICDARASCCSGTWDSTCVEMVGTVCDATCGMGSGCVHGVCTVGGPLDRTCSPCITTVCDARASCCSTAWDATCVALSYSLCGSSEPYPPTGENICDYALYSLGTLTAQGTWTGESAPFTPYTLAQMFPAGNATGGPYPARTHIKGGNVGGTIGSQSAQTVNIEKSVFTAGSTNYAYSWIGGTAFYTTGSLATAAARIDGGVQLGTWAQPPRPTRSPTCAGGAAAGASPTPGDFGATTVAAGTTMTLTAGNYRFSSLTMGPNSRLAIDASGGRVVVDVCGNVDFQTGSQMTGLSQATALNFDLYATGTIWAAGNNVLYGLFNTNSSFSMVGAGTLRGMAFSGGNLVVNGGSLVDATGLRDDCITLNGGTGGTPERLCSYGLYSKTNLYLGTSVQVDGGIVGLGGAADVDQTGVQIHDSLLAGGAVSANGTYVLGEVRAASITSNASTRIVNGRIAPANATQVPTPSFPSIPTNPCSNQTGTGTTGASNQNYDNNTYDVPAGSYGTLSGNNNARLRLSGTYYVNRFTLANGADIEVVGSARIIACQDVLINGNNPQFFASGGATPLDFVVYALSSSATRAIYLNTNQAWQGLFIAPNGRIEYGAQAVTHRTMAWANDIRLGNDTRIDATGMAGSVCATAGLDAGLMCPVTLAPPVAPPETAQCIDNAVGYIQPYCPGGWDLALGDACRDEVEVCNHGGQDYMGDVVVGFWEESDWQMATESPTVSTMDGTCSLAAQTIQAGQCLTVPCAPALTGWNTMMVAPETAVGECSRLDNWTVNDGRSCSSIVTGPTTIYETYYGDCPVNTGPVWTAVGWDASLTDDGRVAFSTRVANTEVELAAETFDPVVTATTANPSCSVFGSCAADISAVVGANESRKPWLELEITVNPGVGTAALNNWRVSYTCAYDE